MVEPAGPAPTTTRRNAPSARIVVAPVESARMIDRIRVEPNHGRRSPTAILATPSVWRQGGREGSARQAPAEGLNASSRRVYSPRAAKRPLGAPGHGRFRKGRRNPGRNARREPAGLPRRLVQGTGRPGRRGRDRADQARLPRMELSGALLNPRLQVELAGLRERLSRREAVPRISGRVLRRRQGSVLAAVESVIEQAGDRCGCGKSTQPSRSRSARAYRSLP